MNLIMSYGNYVLIQLNGATQVTYSKKDTKMNLFNEKLEIYESGDGRLTINKSDVDSGQWSLYENEVSTLLTWEQIVEFVSINTANFNTASGGSGANVKEFSAICDFPYRSPAMYNVINTLGVNVSINYIGTGTYSLDFDAPLDETKLVVMNSQGSSGNILPLEIASTYVIFRHYAFNNTVQEVANTIQVYMKYFG